MEPRNRKKRHPILWVLVILLALGWLARRGSDSSDQTERTLSLGSPAPEYRVTAAPQTTARPTVTPRPTVRPTPTARPAPKTTPEPSPEPSQEPTPARTGVTPEFKEAMDKYEAFFDEYAAFMQAIDENPGNLGLLLQYSVMLERYAETMEALDAIGEEELSDADSMYYLQTMTRIEAKLLGVMQDMG